MASDAVIQFHNQLMAQERARVLDRIAYGTKATSPQIVMARRMNSLYYSNPLPDNSSGSKNRPIGAAKDESGRADANQQVAMAQGQHHFPHEGMPHGGMRGGVLRNYKYAKMILERRGRNTEDINLASQGLPPVPGPLLELSDVESRKLELDTLITSLDDAIATGNITQLTVAEIKNIPRLMVSLAPTFTQNDITSLIRQFQDMTEELEVSNNRTAQRIMDYFEDKVLLFLKALAEIINLQPQDKILAIRQLIKEIFKYDAEKKKSSPSAIAEEPENEMQQGPPGPPEEPPEEEQPEPEERLQPVIRHRPIIAQQPPPEEEEAIEPIEEEPVADDRADAAREYINNLRGRANRVPKELVELYEAATRRSAEGKNFGKLRTALLNWIKRNEGSPRFDAWYESQFD